MAARVVQVNVNPEGGVPKLQVTDYAAPCATIVESFLRWNVTRIAQEVHPGWSRLYAAVLQEGIVRPGDAVEWLPQDG